MIMSFDKEIDALRRLGVTIPHDVAVRVAMELFIVYDRGFAAGRDHAVRIVQRRAMNPRPIVEEIRKPIR